jgi:hypothetical protein
MEKTMSRFKLLKVLFIVAALVVTGHVALGDPVLRSWVVNGAGAANEGSGVRLVGHVGQSEAGSRIVSGNIAIRGGFIPTSACIADFNANGVIAVSDIFDYLNAWFAGNPAADIDGGGLAVSDIFSFLNHWFRDAEQMTGAGRSRRSTRLQAPARACIWRLGPRLERIMTIRGQSSFSPSL